MSTTEQVTLNDLTYFWLPNGAPCFVADRPEIEDIIESLGFQIYYLLAHKETVSTPANNNKNITYPKNPITPTSTFNSKIFKVVNNFVGRCVSVVDEDFGPSIQAIKEQATYSMPAIPSVIVQKLDEFFRLVYSQHGTESIVLLTYDTTKEGSDGWGILVPEQTNTAAHCKYDPDSVAVLKEDHVMIVGSVHSHPQMPAYASGTDHDDQADFDGLHITYGWQASVANGATQYHFELQMAGTAYTLTAQDVFEQISFNKAPDPDVVEWSQKVKKALPPQSQAGVHLGSYNTQPLKSYTTGYTPGGTKYPVGKRNKNIPTSDAIAEKDYLICAEIDTYSGVSPHCPSCKIGLMKHEVHLHGAACPACDIAIVPMDTNIQEIVASLDIYQTERNASTFIAYYLWIIDYRDSDLVIKLKGEDDRFSDSSPISLLSSQDDEVIHLPSVEVIEEDEEYNEWEDLTLCCGISLLDTTQSCLCDVSVNNDHSFSFDEKMISSNLEFYKNNSICETCTHYYLTSCPLYRNSVVDFIQKDVLPQTQASGCDSWVSWQENDKKELEWENYGV